MSENGWTDDYLCTEWFRKAFIPQVRARNPTGNILLIFDGHGSHLTPEIRELAEKNRIELFCLPPHTTHHTQPLDVGVFGPLQRRWMERCDQVLEETGEVMRKVDFVKEYLAARHLAFQRKTIIKAWAQSGIRPLNPKVFTNAHYAPSTNTSTHARLPASYPVELDEDSDTSETLSQSLTPFPSLTPMVMTLVMIVSTQKASMKWWRYVTLQLLSESSHMTFTRVPSLQLLRQRG